VTLLLRWAAAAAGVIFGLINALVRPLVKMLSCGLIVLTLGLFLLVINAAMLWLASVLASTLGFGFEVRDFGSAILGAIIISLATWTFSLSFRDRD
jgi:putative membrane protein